VKEWLYRKDEGFTFVETLIVLAIMLILSAGIGIPAARYIEKARRISATGQIETFRLALQDYALDCGRLPTTEQGLAALYEKPTVYPISDAWDGPYTDKAISDDPWGTPWQYTTPGPDGLPCSIVSYGPDKSEGGTGANEDICSWK
jgi:general secretion pathway protein G